MMKQANLTLTYLKDDVKFARKTFEQEILNNDVVAVKKSGIFVRDCITKVEEHVMKIEEFRDVNQDWILREYDITKF